MIERNENTVILTVHNKALSIVQIMKALELTISNDTKKVILIDDGSTDGTTELLRKFCEEAPKFQYHYLPDVWEVRANAYGLRQVKTEFATIVQDDMLLLERSWDRVLMDVAKKNNAFCVSGRGGHEISQDSQNLYFFDHVGREYPLGSSFLAKVFRKILNIMPVDLRIRCSVWVARVLGARRRSIVNRGPLLVDMQKYVELGGLDENFAPFELDDVDICLRAIKEQKGYNYVLPILYREVNGSKQNNQNSAKVSLDSIKKNRIVLIKKHSEFIKYEKKKAKYRV